MKCIVCDKVFETKMVHKKYCSYTCAKKYLRLTRIKENLWKLSEEDTKLRKKLLSMRE